MPPSPISEPEHCDQRLEEVEEEFFDQVPRTTHIEIHMAFDPDNLVNKKLLFQSCDPEVIYKWMVKQREKADAMEVVGSVMELEEKVSIFTVKHLAQLTSVPS